MSKLNLIVLSCVCFLTFAKAGPIIVGGGGGTAEFYLVQGAKHYPELLQICLAQTDCSRDLAAPLQQLLALPLATQIKLEFLTPNELGTRRFVRRGPFDYQVNKQIMFTHADGQLKPWLNAEAISFLFELTLSEITLTKESSALLQSNMATLATHSATRSSFLNSDKRVFVLASLETPLNALVIETAENLSSVVYEIPFKQKLDCVDSSGFKQSLGDLKIDSAYWIRPSRRDDGQKLIIKGQISYNCQDKNARAGRFKSDYQVSLWLSNKTGLQDWINVSDTEIVQSGIEDQN